MRIFGDKDIYVKDLSTVQLKCVVSQSLVAPTYIEWRHDGRRIQSLPDSVHGSGGGHSSSGSILSMISSDSSRRGRPRLQTTPPEHIAEGTTMSTLTILHARTTDSGTYTCHPTQLEEASVNLHVLESKSFKIKISFRRRTLIFILRGAFPGR